MKNITGFILSCCTVFVLTPLTIADNHAPQATMEGAFSTLMVAAPDVGKYVASMKKDVTPFKALGSQGAGVCVVKSGHDYPGQMQVWNAFSSVQAALVGSSKYDPYAAPSRLARLRDVKYAVTWKPIKPFKLAPGYERVQRVKVAPENVPAFVASMSDLEAAIQEGGHPDFFNGVFVPIGGGKHESQTLMLRSISPTPEASGALFDEYFAGNASWAAAYMAVAQHIDSVESDNFELCEQFYFGE